MKNLKLLNKPWIQMKGMNIEENKRLQDMLISPLEGGTAVYTKPI
jgi:hypothetical protein